MAETEERIPEFRRTKNPENAARKIESGCYDALFPLFDEYPIYSIREAILRRWSEYHCRFYFYRADWIETRICDLGEEETETHSGFWEKLLSCYIFCAYGELAFRAIEFAIAITNREDFGGTRRFSHRSDILKIIAGKLGKEPEIYYDIGKPSLKIFLESFLIEAYQPEPVITYDMMIDIRRVVNCIVKVEDWGFLTLIERVLNKLYNQERTKIYNFKQEAEIKEDLVFLKEAVRLCREKTEKEKGESL